jgi:RNA polymerase sigma-70 factor (ECF subfamily)
VCAEETALATPAGPATDPENVAMKHDRNRIVQNAVMSLPQHYREAVLLFYFDGLSVEEAAQAMGTSVTAAKVRLHRARAKLGAALEGRL